MSLLSIQNMHVDIHGDVILKDIHITMESGRVCGVIGESGSGKSMTALAIMGLLPDGAKRSGKIDFNGNEISSLRDEELCEIRGRDIGMVFQEPMTALNPVHTIGQQVMECIQLHQDVSRQEARAIASDTLARCGLPPERFPLNRYPHQLSGGQRQRVVIAMAVALKPKLLIADEPTTALDVTTQAEILSLLRNLQRSDNMAMMLISHDLAVVADVADEVVIMKGGEVVERSASSSLFLTPKHSYTRNLIAASTHAPVRDGLPISQQDNGGETLLEVENLVCAYPLSRRSIFSKPQYFHAVDNVSFHIDAGESLGLVGESGCGKSTLSRALLGLMPSINGTARLQGKSLSGGHALSRNLRRELQVVFQDPYGSFNPRHRVRRLVAEPLHVLDNAPQGRERRELVAAMLESVGLLATDAEKYIHEFSGGQRQRIAIARALIIRPKLIILDEAVSALDVSVRAKVLDLLARLATDYGLAYLFISHDLSVVRNITDRVMVMQQGKIVESGLTEQVFSNPGHEYTKLLIQSTPKIPSTDSKQSVSN